MTSLGFLISQIAVVIVTHSHCASQFTYFDITILWGGLDKYNYLHFRDEELIDSESLTALTEVHTAAKL